METGTTHTLHRSAIALLFKALTILVPVSLVYCLLAYLASREVTPFNSLLEIFTNSYRIFCLGLFLEVIRLYFNDLYILSERNITHSAGRISLFSSRTSVNYQDVRDADIDQGIMGRLFNYGTVIFGTAATEGHEIEFKDLPYPNEVTQLVREHIKAIQKNNDASMTDSESTLSNE